MKSLRRRSRCEEDTAAWARALAPHLRPGHVIGLIGELGTGKTTFVRALAAAMGVPPSRVRSPTFTLVNEYEGGRLPFYHLDLYRLEPTAVDRLALREYLYGDGICVVEWIERLGEDSACLEIRLAHSGPEERTVEVTARGETYDSLVTDAIWTDPAARGEAARGAAGADREG